MAIVVSVIDHLRRSYASKGCRRRRRHRRPLPLAPGHGEGQLVPGLVVYRFTSGLYYANANRFNEEILALVDGADPAAPSTPWCSRPPRSSTSTTAEG